MLNKPLSVDNVYYLATPYSSKDPAVSQKRYEEQQRLLAHLTANLGLLVVAPIEMCHHLSKTYNLPSGYEYWKKRDRTLISRSDGVIVGKIPGWGGSVGVADEVNYALELGLPVYSLDPITLEIIEGIDG